MKPFLPLLLLVVLPAFPQPTANKDDLLNSALAKARQIRDFSKLTCETQRRVFVDLLPGFDKLPAVEQTRVLDHARTGIQPARTDGWIILCDGPLEELMTAAAVEQTGRILNLYSARLNRDTINAIWLHFFQAVSEKDYNQKLSSLSVSDYVRSRLLASKYPDGKLGRAIQDRLPPDADSEDFTLRAQNEMLDLIGVFWPDALDQIQVTFTLEALTMTRAQKELLEWAVMTELARGDQHCSEKVRKAVMETVESTVEQVEQIYARRQREAEAQDQDEFKRQLRQLTWATERAASAIEEQNESRGWDSILGLILPARRPTRRQFDPASGSLPLYLLDPNCPVWAKNCQASWEDVYPFWSPTR